MHLKILCTLHLILDLCLPSHSLYSTRVNTNTVGNMAGLLACLLITLLLTSSLAQLINGSAALQYVDPLIGTVNGGHVFAGATLPFGMAKAVADVNGEDQGGYASDNSSVIGFSHMHDSGTGGGASLGNFPIFPQAGCPDDDLNRCKFSKSDRAVNYTIADTKASPGYFSVTLNTSIVGEMTVTNHTALYRFTFPDTPVAPYNETGPQDSGPLSPLIITDLSDLSNSR